MKDAVFWSFDGFEIGGFCLKCGIHVNSVKELFECLDSTLRLSSQCTQDSQKNDSHPTRAAMGIRGIDQSKASANWRIRN